MLCFLIISQNVFFLFLSYQYLWKAHQFGFCPHHNWSMRSAMTSTWPNLVVNSHLRLAWPVSCKWLTWPSCFQGVDVLLNSPVFYVITFFSSFLSPNTGISKNSVLRRLFSLFNHCIDYLNHLMFLNTMFTLMTAFLILRLPVLVLWLLFLYL